MTKRVVESRNVIFLETPVAPELELKNDIYFYGGDDDFLRYVGNYSSGLEPHNADRSCFGVYLLHYILSFKILKSSHLEVRWISPAINPPQQRRALR